MKFFLAIAALALAALVFCKDSPSVKETKSNECYAGLPPQTTAEDALKLCGPEFEED
jgi:hypothetical protein